MDWRVREGCSLGKSSDMSTGRTGGWRLGGLREEGGGGEKCHHGSWMGQEVTKHTALRVVTHYKERGDNNNNIQRPMNENPWFSKRKAIVLKCSVSYSRIAPPMMLRQAAVYSFLRT